jgi:hypothetical protein
MPDSRESSPTVHVLTALVLAGTTLRLWQYAGNASLWLDEIALAKNILDRPWVELLTAPLDYLQSAPKGFLLAEKLAVTVFGPNEYALRLFPLLASLAALILFHRVAESVLTGFAVPIAVALFAAATPLIFYAAQVKQYSVDVFAAVFLLWLALDLDTAPNLTRSRILRTALFGAAVAWISDAAVLILGGLALFFAARAWNRRRSEDVAWRRVALVPALWGVSAVTAVAAELATTSAETRAYMQLVWARGMLPVNPLNGVDALWPLISLTSLFGHAGRAALAYPMPLLYVSLSVVGFALLWQRRRDAALLLVLPIAVTVTASAARQYPFVNRLILFLIPGFLLVTAESIEWLRRRAARINPLWSAAALIALTAPALYRTAAAPPVYRVQDIKPALAYLQTKRQDGDAVYVYYRSGPSVIFYGPRYGLGPDDYVSGGCHVREPRRFLEEIDQYRGRARLWVVAADLSWMPSPADAIVDYLDATGTRLDSFVVRAHTANRWDTASAGVYLYDLSDPARFGRLDARTAPLRILRPPVGSCSQGPITVDPARRTNASQQTPEPFAESP